MDKEIYLSIEKYKQRLAQQRIEVKKVLLFGSRAKGDHHQYSDLDLVVVSNDFKNLDLWERLSVLGMARAGLRGIPVEILGVTEEEFERGDAFTQQEIKPVAVEL